MSVAAIVAVVGAGEIGGAVARALARRSRFQLIRLIDDDSQVAAGKALDIQQSGPIDRSDTRLVGTADLLAAAGASVIVIADAVREGEWLGERGLALIRQLARAGTTAPFVFAGPHQLGLMETAARELAIATDRLIGTAPAALASAVRALVGVEIDGSGVDAQVTVVGRPASWVVAWSTATVSGSLVSDLVPPHRLLAIERSLAGLWPPGAQAIASATAPVVEALALGSRRLVSAAAVLDGEFGARGAAVMLPLALGHGRILRRVPPTLSQRERGTGLFSTETGL